jgi:hypothetical protein
MNLAPSPWYTLAWLTADRPDWQEEQIRIEAAIRHAVAEACEDYDRAIFATWTTFADGVRAYYYDTRSFHVWERFQSLEL